jgi:anaerobic selenocysteine-containing dehydrogenase
VFNHRGSTIRQALITEDTQPGLIVAEGLFWKTPESGQTGINDLTSQKTTDMGEGSTFHESRAAIQPVAR